MFALDADGNGQLSATRLRDDRLKTLFDRADADGNGVVTRDELNAYFTKQLAEASEAQRKMPRAAAGLRAAARRWPAAFSGANASSAELEVATGFALMRRRALRGAMLPIRNTLFWGNELPSATRFVSATSRSAI